MKTIFTSLFSLVSVFAISQKNNPADSTKEEKTRTVFHADAGINLGLLVVGPAPNVQGPLPDITTIPRIGFNAGIYADIPIGNEIYFETGFHFTQQGGRLKTQQLSNNNIIYSNAMIKINTLQIPLMIKAITFKKWFVAGGFSISYLTKYTTTWNYQGLVSSNVYPFQQTDTIVSGVMDNLYKGFRRLELGGNFSCGRYFENGFGIGLNYEIVVLGRWLKYNTFYAENFWMYNNNNYRFQNSGIGIDLTYKFGKGNRTH